MLAATLLGSVQIVFSFLIFLGVLIWALMRAPWIELCADARRQHLFYGSVFILCLLWLVRREFDSGLTFHFIGVTAVALLLNWQLAILAGTLAQLALLVLGIDDPLAFGINGILRVLVPVGITMVISQALERLKPTNLFYYIFVSGFLAGGVSAAATILLGMGVLGWAGTLAPPDGLLEIFGYMLLVTFPEAFINGTVITGLVVFSPELVDTFNSDRYFQEPFDSDKRS